MTSSSICGQAADIWIAESYLDRLDMSVDADFTAAGRYLTVTERLRRLHATVAYFRARRPVHYRSITPGIIVPLELPIVHVPGNELLDAIDEPLDTSAWLKADNDNEPQEEGEDRPAASAQRRIRPGSSHAELRSYIARFKAGHLRVATGKTYVGGHRIEAGTIFDRPEHFGEVLGPKRGKKEKAEAERSNLYFRRLMSFNPATGTHAVSVGAFEFRKAGKVRREVKVTADERAALLAGPLPPITYCPPGLPCGGPRLSDNFLGGWVSATKGRQPPERWQDLADEMTRREEFKLWWRQLPADERKALKTAMRRPTLRAVGEAFGKEGKNAERHGKKVLQAANQNLKKFREEVSIPPSRAA